MFIRRAHKKKDVFMYLPLCQRIFFYEVHTGKTETYSISSPQSDCLSLFASSTVVEGSSRIPEQSFLSSRASGSPTCMFGQRVNNRSGIRLV